MRRWTDKLYSRILQGSLLVFAGLCATSFTCSHARGDTTLQLRKLSFTAGGYVGGNYDPYLMRRTSEEFPYNQSEGLTVDERLSMTPRLVFDWDFYCSTYDEVCFYWNNEVIGKSTNQQYRYVSWQFENGIAFKMIDVFYNHLSAHCLECTPQYHYKYPNENVIGIRLNLYIHPRYNRRGSL